MGTEPVARPSDEVESGAVLDANGSKQGASPHSRRWAIASIVVGIALVVWFFFAWLGLERNAVDAAGESVGSAFAIMILASVAGAVRRPRP